MKISLAGLSVCCSLLVMIGAADATMVTIGTASYKNSDYNLIWDDDNNGSSVVWLDYSNDSGDLTWSGQNTWATGLGSSLSYNINDGFNVQWEGSWRLGNTVDGATIGGYEGDPDNDGIYTYTTGYNLANSEMGHLFYVELGNPGLYDLSGNLVPGPELPYTGEFQNLIGGRYWTATEYTSLNDMAWYFNMLGRTSYSEMYHGSYGLALINAQVAPVPEPSTILLLGSGLLGLGWYQRKRKKR